MSATELIGLAKSASKSLALASIETRNAVLDDLAAALRVEPEC
jgi:spore coat protein CotF